MDDTAKGQPVNPEQRADSGGPTIRSAGPSVGKLLALAMILVTGLITWRMLYLVHTRTASVAGDGEHIETYGFELSALQVSRDTLVASGMPKNGLRAITNPPVMTPVAADAYNRDRRTKYLVPSDRVIGVVAGGSARAYPLRVLNWHEIVNDTLGSRSLAITYSPLCDSAVVFDRSVNGNVLVFGFSGLLYNSGLVLYDQQPGGTGESLWSQMEFRAVAGPAAREGKHLDVVPCAVVRWEDWRRMHPETDVLTPDPLWMDRYSGDPYMSYYGSPDQLRFPVKPLPPNLDMGTPGDRLGLKTPVVVVEAGGERRVVALPWIARKIGAEGVWILRVGNEALRFEYRDNPPTVAVTNEATGTSAALAYAFWFAWYSTHPGDGELQSE